MNHTPPAAAHTHEHTSPDQPCLSNRRGRHPAIEPDRPNWVAVTAVAAGVATLSISEMLPVSVLTPMAASMEVTAGVAGQAVSVTAGVAVVSGLFISPAVRTLDRRRLLLLLSLLQLVSNVLVAVAPSYPVLLLGRTLLGVAVGGFWGLSAALALRLVPQRLVPRALSMIFGAATVAGIAGPPLGSLLAAVISWQGVFLAAGGLSLISLILQVVMLPSMPADGQGRWVAVLRLVTEGRVAAAMGVVVVMLGGRQVFVTYLRPFLEGLVGADLALVSAGLLALGVGGLLGTLLAAPLIRRSLTATMVVTTVLAASLMAALAVFGTVGMVAVGLVLALGITQGVVPVGWSTWISQTMPDRAEMAGGLLVAATQLAVLVGAVLGGAVLDSTGVRVTLYIAAGTLAVAAVLSGLVLATRITSPSRAA